MFRRFGIYTLKIIDGKAVMIETEILINLKNIVSITQEPDLNNINTGMKEITWINTAHNGFSQSFRSAIEYEHLANALDGMRF